MSTTKISQHVIGSGAITAAHVSNITTANITENTNLYHTSARARGAISVTGGYLSYDSGTGVIQLTFSTPASSSNDTTPATTAYVTSAIGAINSFTGTIGSSSTATTQSASDNTTKLATTAFVGTAITNVIGGAPGTLDTLNELAAAINDDASYATTLTTALATKLPLAGGTMTGNLTVPYLATTSYIDLNNSGNRGKIGWSGNHTYIATSSSVGSIIFKNNVSSTAAPQTGGDTLLTIADGPKVGIGTPGPSNNLHVHHANAALGFDQAIRVSTNTDNYTVGRGGGIIMQNADVNTAGIFGIREAGNWQGALTFYTHTSATGNTFGTTFTEKMRISSDGKVGIGTDGPDYQLHIAGGGDFLVEDTGNGSAHIRLRSSSGGTASSNWKIKTGSNNYLYIENDTAGTTDIAITNTGNVGIGNNNPGDRLVVQKNSANIEPMLVLKNDNTTDDNGVSIDFSGKDTGGNNILYGRIATKYTNHATEKSHMIFTHRNNSGSFEEWMRVTHDALVGIGEISPDRTLHVKSGTTNVVAKFESTDGIAAIEFTDPNGSAEIGNNGNDIVLFPAGSEKFRVRSSDGWLIADSAAQVRLVLGSTGNNTNNTSNWIRGSSGSLGFNAASTGYHWEIGGATKMAMDSAGVLTLTSSEFRVNNSATYPLRAATAGTVMRGAAVHHMIVHDHRTPKQSSAPHGHMSFGFTSYALNNSSPWADILYLQSYTDASGGAPNAFVVSRSASNCKIVRYPWSSTSTTAISGGTQYALAGSTSSDQRLKENVVNITNGLDTIKALRPVTFNWTDEFLQAGLSKNETEIEADENGTLIAPETKVENVGLIAQEVEAVLPTIIHENEISFGGTDYKTIHYDKIVPHLIAAIKELEARIKTLEG